MSYLIVGKQYKCWMWYSLIIGDKLCSYEKAWFPWGNASSLPGPITVLSLPFTTSFICTNESLPTHSTQLDHVLCIVNVPSNDELPV